MQVLGLGWRWVEYRETQCKWVKHNQELKCVFSYWCFPAKVEAAPSPTSHDKGLSQGRILGLWKTVPGPSRVCRAHCSWTFSFPRMKGPQRLLLLQAFSPPHCPSFFCLPQHIGMPVSFLGDFSHDLLDVFSVIYKLEYFIPRKGIQSHRQDDSEQSQSPEQCSRGLAGKIQEAVPLKAHRNGREVSRLNQF